MTAGQFDATVRALVGTAAGSVPNPFSAITSQGRFTNEADMGMPELAVDQLLRAAEAVAPRLATDLQRTVPCLRAARTPACYAEAAARFGRKAFRRPLTSEESLAYAEAAMKTEQELGPAPALHLLIEAIVSSPHTVFRVERGGGAPDAAGRLRLTPHELASALAYAITGGPPDEALAAAADQGRLASAAEVRAEAMRLWAMGPAAGVVDQFFKEYFGYPGATHVFKDSKHYPHHKPEALIADTAAFVQELFSARKGFLPALLSADGGFVDPATAASYGLDPKALTGRARVKYPDGQRFGIMTQPSFLAATSHGEENDPIKRGRFVRENLLCQTIPEIPIGVVPVLPDPGPDTTLRQRLAQHTRGDCAACHALMDPLGLVFEQYDHTGRFRTTEAGRPVDTTGRVVGLPGGDVALAGPGELARYLAGSSVVRTCVVTHGFRYFVGRPPAGDDACAVEAAAEVLARSGGDLVEGLTALFVSDTFLFRTAAARATN